MLFVSLQKLFSFSSYLNFCLCVLVKQKKQLYKKKVDFKIYVVTIWKINIFNTNISQDIIARRRWNLVLLLNMAWEIFFLRNPTQGVVKKIFPHPVFYCFPSWRLLKYIENKLHITCLFFIWNFFEKQKEVWN